MPDYGFKVSPPGIDVKSAADTDLAFTSKAFGLKVVATGTVSVTSSGAGGNTATIAHGLGYVPAFICFATGDKSSDVFCVQESNLGASINELIMRAYADGTNLTVRISNAGTSTFRYYIFAEDQNI